MHDLPPSAQNACALLPSRLRGRPNTAAPSASRTMSAPASALYEGPSRRPCCVVRHHLSSLTSGRHLHLLPSLLC
eukprot:2918361-Prymnesium_polylepis.1